MEGVKNEKRDSVQFKLIPKIILLVGSKPTKIRR